MRVPPPAYSLRLRHSVATVGARIALIGLLIGGPIVSPGEALAHGHPGTVDDSVPDAWKIRLCDRMSDVAMRALAERERGLPMRVYPDDGGPGPAVANAIVRRVYEEPGISSPKRAEAFGRGYCNEHLRE